MKTLITIIFLGVIILFGVSVGRENPQSVDQTPTPESQSVSEAESSPATEALATPVAQGGGAPMGEIYYLAQSGTTGEVAAVDVVTKKKRTVFSDKNSKQKIKGVSKIGPTGDSVIIVLGDEFDLSGQLVAVKADGSGQKTVLADQFTSTSSPVISPDQTKLALVSFSNAEPNVGFNLVLMDVDGKNRKSLAKDESGIAQLAFSPDGKQIAFVKGAAATSSEIAVVTIATGKIDVLFSAKDKIIENFDWSSVGLLAVTAVPADKKGTTQSDVYLIDPKNKSNVQVTKSNAAERSPVIAPDATGVAFIRLKNDPLKPGDIVMTLPNGDQSVTLGSGNQLLGWVR